MTGALLDILSAIVIACMEAAALIKLQLLYIFADVIATVMKSL